MRNHNIFYPGSSIRHPGSVR